MCVCVWGRARLCVCACASASVCATVRVCMCDCACVRATSAREQTSERGMEEVNETGPRLEGWGGRWREGMREG